MMKKNKDLHFNRGHNIFKSDNAKRFFDLLKNTQQILYRECYLKMIEDKLLNDSEELKKIHTMYMSKKDFVTATKELPWEVVEMHLHDNELIEKALPFKKSKNADSFDEIKATLLEWFSDNGEFHKDFTQEKTSN